MACTLLAASFADNWCIEAVTFDAGKAACVLWPRCRAEPWLGCLNSTRQCVHWDALAIATQTSPTTSFTTLPSLLVLLLVSLAVFVVLLAVIVLGVRYWLQHHGNWDRDVVPLVQMERPLAPDTIVPLTEQGPLTTTTTPLLL